MSYQIQVYIPPASEPVLASDMITQLRINDDQEEALLSAYITTARQIFESITMRAVYPQTIRQYDTGGHHDRYRYTQKWPDGWWSYDPHHYKNMKLMRGPVTAVNNVKYYDANDTLQTFTDYDSDIISNPAVIHFHSWPTLSTDIHPKLYVEYVAGWTSTTIPQPVVTAIQLLAAHFYEHRTSHTEMNLKDLPMGFKAICSLYGMGLYPSDWRG